MAAHEKLTHATASDATPDFNVSRDRRGRRMPFSANNFCPARRYAGFLNPFTGAKRMATRCPTWALGPTAPGLWKL